jgi:hypothetical protein
MSLEEEILTLKTLVSSLLERVSQFKTNRSSEPPKGIRLFYNNRWEKPLCSNLGIYIHRSKTRTQSFLATSISLSKSIRLEDLLNYYYFSKSKLGTLQFPAQLAHPLLLAENCFLITLPKYTNAPRKTRPITIFSIISMIE